MARWTKPYHKELNSSCIKMVKLNIFSNSAYNLNDKVDILLKASILNRHRTPLYLNSSFRYIFSPTLLP